MSDALAGAPHRRGLGIDRVLVDHLLPWVGDTVADLGCGSGHTLAAAAERTPDLTLIGLDRNTEALAEATALLSSAGASFQALCVDLAEPLPLETESVNRLVSHNLVEELPDPSGLILEGYRCLVPGGRAVWSHTDYDSVVIAGGDRALTQRIIHAFADHADATMERADAQMGRKLPGLIHASPFTTIDVLSNVLLSTRLSGPAQLRVEATAAVLRDAAADICPDEIDAWLQSLRAADRDGRFLYAHMTFIVVAEKRGVT